ICQAVEQYFAPLVHRIETVHREQNSKGVFFKLSLCDSTTSKGYLLSPIDGKPTEESVGTSLDVDDLTEFTFNPYADAPPDTWIYDGLMARGDLVTYLGREKHRKSNFILQLAVCAVAGRDFLTFRYASPTPLTVMILDFESKSGSLKERLDGIIKALNLSEQ